METKKNTAELVAIVSNRDQRILGTYSGTAEARMEALDMISRFREDARAEEVENIYVLEAFEMSEAEKEEVEKQPMKAGLMALAALPERRRLYYYAATTLSPLNLDHSVIPYGEYCYEWVRDPNAPQDDPIMSNNELAPDDPSYRDDPTKGLTTRACPYYEDREIAGVKVPWCKYIGSGGLPWETTDEEEESLMRHFGGLNEMRKNLPHGLLWDNFKCCGLNHYFKA